MGEFRPGAITVNMLWVTILLLPTISQSLSCRFLDTAMETNKFNSDQIEQDSEVFKEFARFVNQKVPQLMLEFAQQRVQAGQFRKFSLDEDNKDLKAVDDNKDEDIPETTSSKEMNENSPIAGNESEEVTIIQNVVSSLKKLVTKIENNNLSADSVKLIFKGIVNGVKDLLPISNLEIQDNTSNSTKLTQTTTTSTTTVPSTSTIFNASLSYFSEWPNLCKMLWFPYHTEKCGEARCM